MRKSALVVTGLLLALAVVACGPPATRPQAEEFQYADTAQRPGARGPVGAAGPAGPLLPALPIATPAPRPYASALYAASSERMIVRNGSLSLVVESVATAAEEVGRIASEVGGFVVSSSLQGEGKTTSAQVAIRVPVDRFDEVLSRLRKLAVRVAADSSVGQDVTQEYSDLQAQVRNLEAAETQLQRIMDRADRVEDVLQVYRELVSTRGQIEQAKGRMQYLERTAAMSSIMVDLRPASNPEPLVREGWSPAATSKDALRGVTAWGQGLVSALIWIGVFSPFWLAGLIALGVVGLMARRRMRGGPPQP